MTMLNRLPKNTPLENYLLALIGHKLVWPAVYTQDEVEMLYEMYSKSQNIATRAVEISDRHAQVRRELNRLNDSGYRGVDIEV